MVAPAQKLDAVYARYSSVMQDGGTSIDVQLDTCHAQCVAKCRDYIDRAKTGQAIAGRDALRRLIRDAEDGLIGRLFVYRYDRLGRTSETHTVVADLEELGVEVISATEGRDSLSRGIQLVVAEDFSKKLAERTRDGQRRRFQDGFWTGGKPPLGYAVIDAGTPPVGRPYHKVPRRLVIDEHDAGLVGSIFEAYLLQAKGLKETARYLDTKGVRTSHGGPWTHTSLRHILKNDIYVGVRRWRKGRKKLDRKTGRKYTVPNDVSEHEIIRDDALRIIDDDLFTAVQERLRERGGRHHTPAATREIQVFTGLLFCVECGKTFYRGSTTAKGHCYPHYSCGTRSRLGTDACCNTCRIGEDHLMETITQRFATIFEDADAIICAATKEAERLVASNRATASRLRADMKELDRQRNDLTRLLTDPDIKPLAKEAISDQLGEVQTQRKAVQAALDALVDRANDQSEQLARMVRKAFEEARKSFQNIASPAQLNEFVRQHVDEMVVHRDGRLTQRKTASEDADAVSTQETPRAGLEPATCRLTAGRSTD